MRASPGARRVTPIRHLEETTPRPPMTLPRAAASAHFLGVAEQIVQNKVVERIPVGHIAPDLRPEMRQARLLVTTR